MVDSELLKKYGFDEEEIELGSDIKGGAVYAKTGFPAPIHSYRLIHERHNQSIEEQYFHFLDIIRHGCGYHDITKITDYFSASEHSAFFGNAQQRLGLQQDKVSAFLATIGKMVKELFQLVRELRILDERIGYYEDSMDPTSKSRESADITLKGIWIDMVEQGAKNPASVYGMSRELHFATLPDLFFSIHPLRVNQVDEMVDKLDFNRKVKEVLKRKLRTYMQWRVSTYKEIVSRKIFTIKYLRQHYDIIRMYMNWVKPYLRNIRRLHLKDESDNPDLIGPFEGALIEIELLAKKFPIAKRYGRENISNKHVYSVMLVTFNYRAAPHMTFAQEYQKGPSHTGEITLDIRAYNWSKKKINDYLKMKEEDDFRLLETVDESVKRAMEALGFELEKYLKEAEETINVPFTTIEKRIEKNIKQPGAMDPFVSVVKGFSELFVPSFFKGKKSGEKKEKISKALVAWEDKQATSVGSLDTYYAYKEMKKSFDMIWWA